MRIIQGDCLDVLRTFDDNAVDCTITSVPYLRQRVYGDDSREIGRESSVSEYVQCLADVFDEVRRVTKGLTFLNIGDKANYSGGAGGDWTGKGGGPGPFRDETYQPQSFIDVPGQVLHELLLRGWRLRSEIIWNKELPKPEQLTHVKRPLLQHERIYMLAKGRYDFYPEGLVETGNVWTFPPGGSGPKHLAPFPDELPTRCIQIATKPGDTVLDPFSGAGTTARVATQLDRVGIGIELYAPEPQEN